MTSDTSELDARAVERVIIDALLPTADAVLIDRPDWAQQRTPSIVDGTGNGVYLAKLSADDADARIAEVMREYREQGSDFRWFVGPSSTPADLPERLTRAGMSLFGRAVGMSMRVPDEVPPVPAGVELREVGPGDVAHFGELSMRAWVSDEAFGLAAKRAATRALARGDGARRSWLLWEGGEALGVTTLCLLSDGPGIGYFQGAAVLPARRRAGLYRAMLHHRLALLRQLGLAHAVIWANERSSASSGERVGFKARCRGEFFEYRHAS